MEAQTLIASGKAVLGIEFGSTRIKAVLIDAKHKPIAQGSHMWENHLENGLWTYSEEEIIAGMQACFASLKEEVRDRYGVEITRLAGIGVSAMMHGYIALDKEGQLLTPFRTWRNTNTGAAARRLSELFNFNMPLRWSLSHLYQCILDGEEHVKDLDFLTTLAGYIHWRLTGEKVLGLGDASGMMPLAGADYDSGDIKAFDALVAPKGYPWRLEDILPRPLPAGVTAGSLSPEGALLLDPSGALVPGAPFCPPEGDAGTGMVATNAVRPRTGNVSAGTSSFSMLVLEKPLSRPYEVIDIVTTPDGAPVAMVHCNNCTSDINDWVGVFKEFSLLLGTEVDDGKLYDHLFRKALEGEPDCGGLLSYNYVSGEPVTGFSEGRPLFVRSENDHFTLANFFRAALYGSVGVLHIGNKVLFEKEQVKVNRLMAHGGLFKTPEVGQRILAAALNAPVSVMETAGEGGAWGMALLASFAVNNPGQRSLPDYLDRVVFADASPVEVFPSQEDVKGFIRYMTAYEKGLPVEKAAIENKS